MASPLSGPTLSLASVRTAQRFRPLPVAFAGNSSRLYMSPLLRRAMDKIKTEDYLNDDEDPDIWCVPYDALNRYPSSWFSGGGNHLFHPLLALAAVTRFGS